MFEYRWLTESDYDEICRWWKDNRFPPIPREFLPDNGTCGIMISRQEINVCAGFLYTTNSAFAWIEYVVMNFDVKDREVRKKARNMLVEIIISQAQMLGSKALFSSCKNEHMKKILLENGFAVGTDKTTELIKIL